MILMKVLQKGPQIFECISKSFEPQTFCIIIFLALQLEGCRLLCIILKSRGRLLKSPDEQNDKINI